MSSSGVEMPTKGPISLRVSKLSRKSCVSGLMQCCICRSSFAGDPSNLKVPQSAIVLLLQRKTYPAASPSKCRYRHFLPRGQCPLAKSQQNMLSVSSTSSSFGCTSSVLQASRKSSFTALPRSTRLCLSFSSSAAFFGPPCTRPSSAASSRGASGRSSARTCAENLPPKALGSRRRPGALAATKGPNSLQLSKLKSNSSVPGWMHALITDKSRSGEPKSFFSWHSRCVASVHEKT
mmetsp:Transcript_49491/g.143572  ORF Transcript_49491/g.143572 Transcript_49491/m.143572 type:complete len:235 (-) Transcript_49491:591-1295(-)